MEKQENKGGCLKGRKKSIYQRQRRQTRGGCLLGKKGTKTGLTREELNAVRGAEARLTLLNNL